MKANNVPTPEDSDSVHASEKTLLTPATPLASRPLPVLNQRKHHAEILAGTLLLVLLASLSSVSTQGKLTLPGTELTAWELPAVCGSQRYLGLECPGCGLTRGVILSLQGKWAAAWQYHRLAWLVAFGVVLQIPYRTLGIFAPQAVERFGAYQKLFLVVALGLLIANWLLEKLI